MNTSCDPEPGDAIQAEALARFLEDWQVEHGALAPAEIAKAEQELGLGPGSPETGS
jgi:hypothetical protein